MKKLMRIAAAAATAAMVLAMTCIPTMAATRISSLSVSFEAEGYDEEGLPIITGSTKATNYTVDSVDASIYKVEVGDTEEPADDVYVVTISAADGYVFSTSLSSEKIRLSGLGARYVSGYMDDDRLVVTLRVYFSGAYDLVEEVEQVAWGENGRGTWSSALGARKYELTITGPSGKTAEVETYGTSYDFSPFMQKAGSYTFSVRPLSASDKRGDRIESGVCIVSEDTAAANAARYSVGREVTYKDGVVLPSNEIVTYHNIGWQTAADGRMWYKNKDGSYPQESWLSENGSWYYFGADGYMKADTYYTIGGQDYYFGADGRMVTSAVTPDGRTAGADGVLPKW